MKNLFSYIKEMHDNDPTAIPVALGICLGIFIASMFFSFLILLMV